MKKFINFIIASLLTTTMFLFTNTCDAQIINSQTAVDADYDPISATLDSLVNQVYIRRLNINSSPGGTTDNVYQSFEVPSFSAEVYKQKIEKIQTPIPLCYNDEVRQYIDLYALKKRSLTERVMGQAALYFPLFEQILDQQGLPLEFKYLSIVESALNPTAVSRYGATGLWQFMLGTGKMYNLKINSFIDERRDPEKSTLAACQYFKDMYAIYNDWLLVIAAYNCGAGNVNKAIARSGGKKTFWEICDHLPRETRGYVPAFIAVTYLMTHTNDHNLKSVPPLISYYGVDTVMTDRRVTLKQIADAINLPIDYLSYLNPIYKKGVIPVSDQQMAIRLPSNKVNTYLANLSTIYKVEENTAVAEFVSNDKDEALIFDQVKKYHRVKRGEHLLTIAKHYHCSVNDIKSWNRLRSTKLSSGQKLTIYTSGTKKAVKVAEKSSTKKSTSAAVKTNNQITGSSDNTGDSKFVWHTVQSGDSLWKIAQRYQGVTVAQIKELNNLQSNELKVGTKLKVVING